MVKTRRSAERLAVQTLLIEDDSATALKVRQILRTARGLDVEVDWCERLGDGLEQLKDQAYDVILLDLALPDVDALDVVRALLDAAPLTPVVVLSGEGEGDLALQAVRHGALDYIPRDRIDRVRLGMAIRHAIEHRRADATLRRQEARLAEVFAQLPQGIVVVDPGGRLRFANPLAQEYLAGLTPERVHEGDSLTAIGGMSLGDILGAVDDRRPPVVVGHGWSGPRTFEVRAREVMGVPRGQRLLTLREISEDRDLVRSLETQHRVAAIGALAAAISARFSRELAGLEAAGRDLANSEELPAGVRPRAASIVRHLDRARDMVDRILRFSRDHGGPPRRIDLAATLFELGDVLHHLIPESIDVELEVEPGEYPILATPADIEQVFTNLAVNARDAMPSGGRLTLVLNRLALAPGDMPPIAGITPGRWAVAAVADTGVGVSEEDRVRVFDPFFTTKSGVQATGLGLPQVFKIVRDAGGFVALRPRVGFGTRVLVYLPFAEEGAGAAPLDLDGSGSGTVLVVGMVERGRGRLVELLERFGYEARTVGDSTAALKAYGEDSERIVAVVCSADPEHPGAPDGRDLAEALAEIDPLVRVLLLTGRSPSSRARRGHPAVSGWIQAPVEPLGLRTALILATQDPS